MAEPTRPSPLRSARLLIAGLVAVIVVLTLALIVMIIPRGTGSVAEERVNVLEGSSDRCVACHSNSTPGIVEQYGHSSMAAAKVTCQDCHVVEANYPGSIAHEGVNVLAQPTTAMCEKCHQTEVAQFNQSRHGLPAYVAVAGSQDLSPQLLAVYEGIAEGQYSPNKARNLIAQMEGPEITGFACESCHNVGRPAADGSVGQCQKCHSRHEFSLEQARKPETCNNCHIGPDHPQWEIYFESKHGIKYSTDGDNWNWEAEPGTLTVADFPAPTCATCHFSGFGSAGTTHDVGDRLSWYLFAPVSERRPTWQDNRVRMQGVCAACHNQDFVENYYAMADGATEAVNGFIHQSDEIIAPLHEQGLLTDKAFDEPIDFVHFETWHHYGRTAKFGVWMQGADYTQWHGAYEVVKGLVELQSIADELLDK